MIQLVHCEGKVNSVINRSNLHLRSFFCDRRKKNHKIQYYLFNVSILQKWLSFYESVLNLVKHCRLLKINFIFCLRWQSNQQRISWGQPSLRSCFNCKLAFVGRSKRRLWWHRRYRKKSQRKIFFYRRCEFYGRKYWARRNRDRSRRQRGRNDSSPAAARLSALRSECKEAKNLRNQFESGAGCCRLQGEKETWPGSQEGLDAPDGSDCRSGQRFSGQRHL